MTGTEFWRVVAAPQMLSVDTKLQEYDIGLLSREFRACFGELLQRCQASKKGFTYSMIRFNNENWVGYSVPQEYCMTDVISGARYLFLERDQGHAELSDQWSRVQRELEQSRAITKQPRFVLGGVLDDLQQNLDNLDISDSLADSELKLLECEDSIEQLRRSRDVVAIPTVSLVTGASSLSQWAAVLRNLTTSTTNAGFKVTINPYRPAPKAISYSQQCISLYLHTYRTLSNGRNEELDLAIHRAIFGQQDLFRIKIEVANCSVQAFQQDTDSSVLIKVDDHLKVDFDGVSEETAEVVQSLPRTYSKGEALCLCIPPFSFVDALPCLENRVPKPFVVPNLPKGQEGVAEVVLGRVSEGVPVRLPVTELTRHVLICGSSGSGKSYAARKILLALPKQVPYLIIEPAKTKSSYDQFCNDAEILRGRPEITEVGSDAFSINPFIVPPGSTIFAHSALVARAMSMLTPSTPAAYELWLGMVRATYEKKWKEDVRGTEFKDVLFDVLPEHGVDVASSSFPNLSDVRTFGQKWLAEQITNPGSRFAVDSVDYVSRWWKSIETSHPLFWTLAGGKSEPFWWELFERDLILTFGLVTDPQESASTIALLLFLLSEYRVGAGRLSKDQNVLKHMTLVEEAHRVMPSKARSFGTDLSESPQQEAGLHLSQMLAEMRELGEGFMIAEQSPTKLLSDALVNTGTKIIKRTIYGPDVDALAEGLGLSERERLFLPKLSVKEAVILIPSATQAMFVYD